MPEMTNEATQEQGPKRMNAAIYVTLAAIGVLIVVVVTLLLTPQETNPAYAAAITFVNTSGQGEDSEAMAQLSPALQAYVSENCEDGSVSACIATYTPPDWGEFLNAVFRRAQPDGRDAWDILLLATYAENQGFSGVCIYNRAERVADDTWQITRWSGWISCDLPNSGLSSLLQPGSPNEAP